MGRSKIVDEAEVIRWIEEGRTYREMTETYLEKYNLQVSPTMFSNFRSRRGLDGRIVRDDNLIPWQIKPEHRYAWAANMLRVEGRRRAGKNVSPNEAEQLAGWKRTLEREGAVIHYDPDTAQGFFLVPPRPDVDTDLIRVPDRRTTVRPSMA